MEPEQDPARKWWISVTSCIAVVGLAGWIFAIAEFFNPPEISPPDPAATVYQTVGVPTMVPSPSPSPYPVPGPTVYEPGQTVTVTVTAPGTTVTVIQTVTVTPTPAPTPSPSATSAAPVASTTP